MTRFNDLGQGNMVSCLWVRQCVGTYTITTYATWISWNTNKYRMARKPFIPFERNPYLLRLPCRDAGMRLPCLCTVEQEYTSVIAHAVISIQSSFICILFKNLLYSAPSASSLVHWSSKYPVCSYATDQEIGKSAFPTHVGKSNDNSCCVLVQNPLMHPASLCRLQGDTLIWILS